MKLLNLRLSNLNSLYGEWSIDFEHRDYVANGLFAITGPTGAGKSTLLDAISLALYGRTPRLGTISNSANEIMSRDCGECFAEVTFQSSKGTFRAHWSQRRARSKADGNLQAPQHELTDALTQRVVTAKKTETLATIQDYVGLDYEQFMRSIMLAQGEFATFLKSEDGKRAAILAKITGTDIYARIGSAVYQRFRTETDSLDLITLQSSAIEILSEEAITELKARIEDSELSLATLSDLRIKTEEAIRWFERLDHLHQEIATLREESRKAAIAVDTAMPLRRLYDRAQRASPLQRSLEGIQNLQSRLDAAQKTLEQKKVEFAEAGSQTAKTRELLEKAKLEISAAQTAIESSRPIWLATHDLDLQIGNAKSNLESTCEQFNSIELKCQRLRQEKINFECQSNETKVKLAQIRCYQVDHHFDAELVGLLPKIEHLVEEYKSLVERMQNAEAQIASISSETSQAILDRSAAEEHLILADRAVVDRKLEIDALESGRYTTLDGNSVDDLQTEVNAIRSARQAIVDQIKSLEAALALKSEMQTKSEERDTLKQTILKNQDILAKLEKHVGQKRLLVAALETSFFKDQLIAQLREHRSRLVAGQPCELCGSTNHPWADGRTNPVTGDTELALNLAKQELAQAILDRDASIRIVDRDAHLLAQSEETIRVLEESLKLAISGCENHAMRFGLDSEMTAATVESKKQSIEQFNIEEAKLVARIRGANLILEEIAKSREALTKLVANKAAAEQAFQSLANAQKNLDESKQRKEVEILQQYEGLQAKREELAMIFERLELSWPEDLAGTLASLKNRSVNWLNNADEAARFEKVLLLTDGSIASLLPQIDQSDQDWKALQKLLSTQSTEMESFSRHRNELFGSRDPQATERELQSELDEKVARAAALTAEYEPMVAALQLLDRQILQIDSSLSTDAKQLVEQQIQLEVDLQTLGFVDFGDLESAIQTQSEIEHWACQLQSIDAASQAANVRLSQKEIEREAWEQNRPSDSKLELLQQQLSDADCSIEGLRRERAELQHRLAENQTKTEQLQGAQLRLATQQQLLQRWSLLNELIGSADGAKFRKFAQGITFELLLAYANIQLAKLTDRYLLKKGDEGLNLVVVDHYQSSRSRSAANLSGGETFLVSLALALGLSKLASQNVQIDSLFLDEGFGTLDEETLDEALHTLSNLRQEGKLVGLISHVAALNQQVPVRIEVLKGSMGRSRLIGPGVK